MSGISPRKKFAAALAAAVAAGGVAVLLCCRPAPAPVPSAMQSNYKTVELSVGAATVLAEVADTPALREKGLSGRTGLEDGKGMWFVFDADGLWAFWMKDTLIPLDMLWADASGTVVHIAHGIRPDSYPEAFATPVPARYVLEVPGGWARAHAIAEGNSIRITL